MSKIGVGQTTANREKKRPNAIRKQYKCLYVDTTTFISLSPDILFIFLFR